MSVFESLGETTEKASDKAQHYVDTTKAYFTLKVFQQVSVLIGVIGKAMIIGGFAFIAFLFLAFSAAIGIGNLVGNIGLGCLIVGLIFLILGYVAYRLRNKIDTKIIEEMAPIFFESK